MLLRHAVAILLLLLAIPLTAGAQESVQRGKLLYLTHCNACHSNAIHWRQQHLVRDCGSLEAQVRRWQKVAALDWSEDDVQQVCHYLNEQYYHFSANDQIGMGSDRQKKQRRLQQ